MSTVDNITQEHTPILADTVEPDAEHLAAMFNRMMDETGNLRQTLSRIFSVVAKGPTKVTVDEVRELDESHGDDQYRQRFLALASKKGLSATHIATLIRNLGEEI